jgi:LmeA-like phospholipid-binding
MRRVLLVLVLLLGLLAVADRLAALAAERVVAERIQTEEALAVRPDVTIGGIPFLTQMFRGRYDDVTVSVHELRRGDLHIKTVRAHLSGVRLPFGDLVRMRTSGVHVAHASARILLTYADLNAFLASKGLHLSSAGAGKVHATATQVGSGGSSSNSADVPIGVTGDSLAIALPTGESAVIPLPKMPFGIKLVAAHATADGITIDCTASGLEFTR